MIEFFVVCMVKKRLLIVSDYYLPHWTGIVKTISYMTDALQKWFDITVLCVQHDKRLPKRDRINGVRIIRSPVILSVSRAKLSLLLFWDIVRETPSCDIVFINSPSAYMAFASIFAKLYGKKLFVFHQGDLILPKGLGNRLIERFFDLSCMISCFLADTVFCATRDYAQNSRVLRYFMNKFLVFPVLAKRKKQAPVLNKEMKSVDKLKKRGFTIFGFAGRFVEEKGFDLVLRAIPSVLRKNPKIHFVFAGDLKVTYEDFFEKNRPLYEATKSHVTVAGLLKEKELEGFYDLLDAVIIPSRSDCFPTIQVEAMIRAKPVIVTDIPGARIPVKKTGFGILIPPNDTESVAGAIIKMSRQKNAYEKFFGNVLSYFNYKRDEQIVRTYLAG